MKKNKIQILSYVIFILFLIYLIVGVDSAKKNNDEERYSILKDAIYRSSVQCYAIEGYYPPNIEYLENNYGIVVDHNKYVINYSVFASNIMPEIEVFLK